MVIRLFSAVVCVSTFDVCSGSVDIPIEFLLFGLVLSVATLDLWRSERGGMMVVACSCSGGFVRELPCAAVGFVCGVLGGPSLCCGKECGGSR